MSQIFRFSMPLLQIAFASAVLSTLLFVVASPFIGVITYNSFPIQWVYMSAHLLGGFGVGTLLWAVISGPARNSKHYWLQCGAVVSLVLYHLVAAVAYCLMFGYGSYRMTMLFWWVRMLLILTIVFKFITIYDELLRITGILLLLAMVASCPFSLSEGWGLVQWIVAKVTALLLAIMLYINAKFATAYSKSRR